jgi:glucokinase
VNPAARAERVGLDVGGTAIKGGRIDADGRIAAEAGRALDRSLSPAAFLERALELARELGAREALGIGLPGLIDQELGGVSEAPNLPYLNRMRLRDELGRALGIEPARVFVENDAKAAALGELWLGAARGEQDALLLTLGTGIGGGLILGGQVFRGAGQAGELGHVTIDPAGPACSCGSRGCLERFASAKAAERRAREAGLPRNDPGNLELLCTLARAGGAEERALLRAIGLDLGRGIAVAVCLLDVRSYVFGGGFSAGLDQLEDGIRAGIAERAFGAERAATIQLRRAQLGPKAGWIGAARLAF